MRHRDRLLQYSAAHIQHMQKALMQMNLQLHHVVTDITGQTGLRIIRAIAAGERDPRKLADLRDYRCKASTETIRQALSGNYRPEHVFALQQALELFDFYTTKLRECDNRIEAALRVLNENREEPKEPAAPPKRKVKHRNEPHFDVQGTLHKLVGIDVSQIHGVGPYAALKLISECGDDMSRWPTAKHFTSWLTLAPGNKISGGKILSSKTRRSANRAASLLRQLAVSVGKTDTALGAFYRRLSARVGKYKAITATARKIAVIFYNMLRYGMAYVDAGSADYEQKHTQRVLANLRRKAKALGYQLVDLSAGTATATEAVS
jgi:transposase